MRANLMISGIVINNIDGEFVPEDIFFQNWLNAIDYKKKSEITIKIVTENEMREFNKLYKSEDKVSDILAFPFDKLIDLGSRITSNLVVKHLLHGQ